MTAFIPLVVNLLGYLFGFLVKKGQLDQADLDNFYKTVKEMESKSKTRREKMSEAEKVLKELEEEVKNAKL